MWSFLKFGFTVLGLILIGLGIGLVLMFGQFEERMSAAASRVLTDAFENTVTVSNVSVSATDRSVILHDFALMNPEGFKEEPALTAKTVRVQMVPRSLIDGPPIIRNLKLEEADVYYRYEVGQGTNIAAIARGFEAKQEDVIGEPQFVVERLHCEEARLHFSTNLIPASSVSMNVVTIDLEELRDDKPIPPREITSILLRSLLMEALTIKGLLSPVVDSIKSALGQNDSESPKEAPSPAA